MSDVLVTLAVRYASVTSSLYVYLRWPHVDFTRTILYVNDPVLHRVKLSVNRTHKYYTRNPGNGYGIRLLLLSYWSPSQEIIRRIQTPWGRTVIPNKVAPGCSCLVPATTKLGSTILTHGVWVLCFIEYLTFIVCINDCKFQSHRHVEENQGWGEQFSPTLTITLQIALVVG